MLSATGRRGSAAASGELLPCLAKINPRRIPAPSPPHQPVPSTEARGPLNKALQAQQAALGPLIAHDQHPCLSGERAEAGVLGAGR
jgi:hypothetical protein